MMAIPAVAARPTRKAATPNPNNAKARAAPPSATRRWNSRSRRPPCFGRPQAFMASACSRSNRGVSSAGPLGISRPATVTRNAWLAAGISQKIVPNEASEPVSPIARMARRIREVTVRFRNPQSTPTNRTMGSVSGSDCGRSSRISHGVQPSKGTRSRSNGGATRTAQSVRSWRPPQHPARRRWSQSRTPPIRAMSASPRSERKGPRLSRRQDSPSRESSGCATAGRHESPARARAAGRR